MSQTTISETTQQSRTRGDQGRVAETNRLRRPRGGDIRRYDRWTAEEIDVLGRLPDAELSEILGRSVYSIQCQRKKWAIPGAERAIRRWTKAEDRQLGSATDEEIARRLKRSTLAVRLRRRKMGVPAVRSDGSRPWTKGELRLLRSLPPIEAARALDRSLPAIHAKRSKLGICTASPATMATNGCRGAKAGKTNGVPGRKPGRDGRLNQA
jgi:hypothetical protein